MRATRLYCDRSQEPLAFGPVQQNLCKTLCTGQKRSTVGSYLSHSRAKLGRMGGFQTVEGVRTFHDHRSAKHLFLFIPGVLKGTSIGGLDIRPQCC